MCIPKKNNMSSKENLIEVEVTELSQDNKAGGLKELDQNVLRETGIGREDGVGIKGDTWKKEGEEKHDHNWWLWKGAKGECSGCRMQKDRPTTKGWRG